MIRRILLPFLLARHRVRLTQNGTVGSNFVFTRNTRFVNHAGAGRIRIGNHVTLLDDELTCYQNGQIDIGHHSWMSLRGQIISARSVRIGNYCIIARDVYISDTNEHPIDPAVRRRQTIALQEHGVLPDRYECDDAPVTIGDDVWIGERAIILKGVIIGNGSIVAAGAVVSKSVPALSVVAGNPARIVKTLSPSSSTEEQFPSKEVSSPQ